MRGANRLPGLPARLRAAAASSLLLASAALLPACGHAASASGGIHVSGASIPLPSVPGRASAYLDIRNNGPADRLVSARTSEGGKVTFSAPATGSAVTHTVSDIAIPSHATLRLVPNGTHLTITGATSLQGGTQITLTLVFAKAGPVSVPATIADSPGGG
jgi:copper(I)-binding protein